MEEKIKNLAEILNKIYSLKNEINDKEYWIKRAQEEAGFIPAEDDWVSVEVQTWKIEIFVYHKSGIKGSKYWINGQWFDTCLPKSIPSLSNIIK